jgi:hypothetical protein
MPGSNRTRWLCKASDLSFKIMIGHEARETAVSSELARRLWFVNPSENHLLQPFTLLLRQWNLPQLLDHVFLVITRPKIPRVSLEKSHHHLNRGWILFCQQRHGVPKSSRKSERII